MVMCNRQLLVGVYEQPGGKQGKARTWRVCTCKDNGNAAGKSGDTVELKKMQLKAIHTYIPMKGNKCQLFQGHRAALHHGMHRYNTGRQHKTEKAKETSHFIQPIYTAPLSTSLAI